MSLRSACDAALANPAFAPSKDGKTTHCNAAARCISLAMGCQEFDNLSLMAEDMGLIMARNESGCWAKATGEEATAHALIDGLAFAFMFAEQLKEVHAHIAAVYPETMQMSGSLGREVPVVANIGKTVGVIRSSQAFPVAAGEASYYIWKPKEAA